MEENKGKLTSRFWITTFLVCLVLVVAGIVGFVVFNHRSPDVIEKDEDGGYVTLNYSSEVNALSLFNAKPTTDAVGMKNTEYFDFSVDVNLEGAPKVEYEISLIKDEEASTIKDEDVRIYLEKEESGTYTKVFGPEEFTPSKNYTGVGSELGSMVLTNVKKIKSETDNYRLRIWMSDKAIASTGNYSVEVDIHAISK